MVKCVRGRGRAPGWKRITCCRRRAVEMKSSKCAFRGDLYWKSFVLCATAEKELLCRGQLSKVAKRWREEIDTSVNSLNCFGSFGVASCFTFRTLRGDDEMMRSYGKNGKSSCFGCLNFEVARYSHTVNNICLFYLKLAKYSLLFSSCLLFCNITDYIIGLDGE